MIEENYWELVYEEEGDSFTRVTTRMKVPGGFLYREEICRDDRFQYPFAAIALQFVPKLKAKVKKKRR